MPEVMDVTGSLRKISRELLALEREDPELELRLEATAFLIKHIADALDVELEHAAARGRILTMTQINPRAKEILRGEDL